MTHFNEVVEEEKARFIGTWLPNGKESEQPQMEADFDQAMHKAVLAVVEELLEKTYMAEFTPYDVARAVRAEDIETIRKQLTDKE